MTNERKKAVRPSPTEEPKVALRCPIVYENLPLPYVHYPNHYGTFHAFSGSRTELPILCDCTKASVANYLELRKLRDMENNLDKRVTAPLSSRTFPDSLAVESLEQTATPLAWLRFLPRLCHRCNLAVPSLRWCASMYGGQFKQCYGWYIRQTMYRLGVMPMRFLYLDRVCPDEVIHLIQTANDADKQATTERLRLIDLVSGPPRTDIAPDEITYWSNVKLEEAEPYQKLQRTARYLRLKRDNYFENVTREEFGLRKIGDAYVSESLLFKIVKRLFPNEEILRHCRPDWLYGLELDISLPKKKLAFEYQGQQHFHPIEAWGGKKSLAELQERDAKKRDICEQLGVTLIAIDYTEPLTENHVVERLRRGTYAS